MLCLKRADQARGDPGTSVGRHDDGNRRGVGHPRDGDAVAGGHESPAVVFDGAQPARLIAGADGVADRLADGVDGEQQEDDQGQPAARPAVVDAPKIPKGAPRAQTRQHRRPDGVHRPAPQRPALGAAGGKESSSAETEQDRRSDAREVLVTGPSGRRHGDRQPPLLEVPVHHAFGLQHLGQPLAIFQQDRSLVAAVVAGHVRAGAGPDRVQPRPVLDREICPADPRRSGSR